MPTKQTTKQTITDAARWQAHHAALDSIRNALVKGDREIRAVRRRSDLFPGEQVREAEQIRDRVRREVLGARARLTEAFDDSRRAALWVEPIPAGADLARAQYLATEAASALNGVTAPVALDTVRRLVEAGDHERARHYLRAARPIADAAGQSAELHDLAMRTRPAEEQVAVAFGRAVEQAAALTPILDDHVNTLLDTMGDLPPDVVEGLTPETPLDVRAIGLFGNEMEAVALGVYQSAMREQRGEPEPAPTLDAPAPMTPDPVGTPLYASGSGGSWHDAGVGYLGGGDE